METTRQELVALMDQLLKVPMTPTQKRLLTATRTLVSLDESVVRKIYHYFNETVFCGPLTEEQRNQVKAGMAP